MKKKLKISKAASKFISRHIRHHIKDLGMKRDQAVAAAYSEAREAGYHIPKYYKHKLKKVI